MEREGDKRKREGRTEREREREREGGGSQRGPKERGRERPARVEVVGWVEGDSLVTPESRVSRSRAPGL
jgi:hypothetical protein